MSTAFIEKWIAFAAQCTGRILSGNDPVSSRIAASVEHAALRSNLGVQAREWVSLAITAGVFSAAGCFAIFHQSVPLAEAVFASLACGTSGAAGAYSIPFVFASRATARMERDLPRFCSRLLSSYAETKMVLPALACAANASNGEIGSRVRTALALHAAGFSAEEAFRELREETGSRRVSMLFSSVTGAIDSGMDVGDALEGVSRDSLAALEFEAEREAKVGMAPFVVSASSAFFFPLFAALGVTMMDVLAKISPYSPYSEHERQLIGASIMFYLFAGVFLDSGYVGRIRFRDFRKGVLFFGPLLSLAGLGVFLAASHLAGSLAGTGQ